MVPNRAKCLSYERELFQKLLSDCTNYILSIKPIGIFSLNMNGNNFDYIEISSSFCISDFEVSKTSFCFSKRMAQILVGGKEIADSGIYNDII